MNDPSVMGLVVVGLLTAFAVRMASGKRHSAALCRLESKVDALLRHEGIQFDPYANLPPTVRDALGRGKKIEAIKEYRLATGAGLKEAKNVVEEVQRRASPRV